MAVQSQIRLHGQDYLDKHSLMRERMRFVRN